MRHVGAGSSTSTLIAERTIDSTSYAGAVIAAAASLKHRLRSILAW